MVAPSLFSKALGEQNFFLINRKCVLFVIDGHVYVISIVTETATFSVVTQFKLIENPKFDKIYLKLKMTSGQKHFGNLCLFSE